MGATGVWILDLAPWDQLPQASLSELNTQLPLTHFSGSQWRPHDSPEQRILGTSFEKRPTLSHFNVISWNGATEEAASPPFLPTTWAITAAHWAPWTSVHLKQGSDLFLTLPLWCDPTVRGLLCSGHDFQHTSTY